MRHSRRAARLLVTLVATAAAAAGVAVAGPAPAAPAAPHCRGFVFLPEAGALAKRRARGGFDICDATTGEVSQTHGPDTSHAGGSSPLPSGETDVECVVHNYGPQIVFLYGHWYPTAWRYLDVRPALQSVIRRMNHKLALAAAASGGTAPRIKTPCMLQDGRWVPWVGGFTNYPGNRAGVADNTYGDIREAMFDNYPRTGHDGAPIKYLVFYDLPLAFPGEADGDWNDDRRWGNANTTTTRMGYVDSGNWTTNNTLHELFHMLGAVQYTAPHSNWIAHCNDGADVMCYNQQGQSGAYSGPYDDYRCSYTEESGYVPLDCKYDTYFDAQTAPGSYLGNYWNVGAPTNPFFHFPYAMDFAMRASPSSMAVNAGSTGSSAISLTSFNNFSGTVTMSASGVPAGSSVSFSNGAPFLTSNGTASTTMTVRVGAAQRSSFTVTVNACGPIGCRTTPVTVTPRYVTVVASPGTLSTLPGGTANTTATVTSRNGYSGYATLSAEGVPSGSSVTFAQSTVWVPGNGSGSSGVTVNTGLTQLQDYSFTIRACAGSACSTTRVFVDVQPL